MPHSTITVFSGHCPDYNVVLGATSVDGKGKPLVSAGRNMTKPEMSLHTTIKVLKPLSEPTEITIRSPETYLTDGISKHILKWRVNGWKTSDRKPVKNLDLWQELDKLLAIHEVKTELIQPDDELFQSQQPR